MSSKKILITGASTGFGNITAKLLAENENPQDVADAILNLVNQPQGQRPLRTVVDKMMGGTTEIINQTAQQVQAGILQNLGLSELNINN